ncbi:MAG TPA: DUF87 domain-containing protein, partial [Gemmataceae bacterium]|nr:DUF87 domain-containing protein [Gemmataceae bacterium]
LPDRPVMYDARDLTTHGVVVGMTGSGKTGLCISLLEEAAIDGIPCIAIDPKGDLTNLLLHFPDLGPQSFLKWLNPEDARQKGVTLEEHARQLAERWRQGLAESGQGPERVARLQQAAEWRVYTPGSEAGLPLSLLQNFAAPPPGTPREALNQRIDATATALLGLTGISADPVQSREHILVAQLLLHAWQAGRDLDLRRLIAQVQTPPMDHVGAFDVDTFYPEKDRLRLAVALNNLLAAPSFSTWITGDPLDLTRLLGGDRARQLIFYVAHLDDAQRMFFITLLLEEVLTWTRRQPGTNSLRAILYFDEVFGYLPPHPANPPTKSPLLALLKQARAFGVGVLLATQNPVDLDYKALSNAGTWFVGKLQTERDKARLIEGLEGAAAERGTLSNRAHLEGVISALGNRVFLLHDVHRPKPLVFQSRWALNYLRGPLTRDQVAELMRPLKERPPGAPAAADGPPPMAIPLCRRCQAELRPGLAACPACGEPTPHLAARAEDRQFKQGLRQKSAPAPVQSAPRARPVLPGNVRQYYLPVPPPPAAPAELVYQPRLLACAEVAFADRRRGLEHHRTYCLLAEPPAAGQPVNWAAAEPLPGAADGPPAAEARWPEVPESVNTAKKLKALAKGFAEFLYGSAKLRLLENRKLGLVSAPQEDAGAFQERCRAAARAEADRAYAAERLKYQPKFEALGLSLPDHAPRGNSWVDWAFVPLRAATLLAKAAAAAGKETTKSQARLEARWKGEVAALYEKWRQ